MAVVSDSSRHQSADVVARCAIAGLFLGLAYRIGLNALETGRLSGLLLLTSELLVVVLTLARRHATSIDRRSWSRVVAGVSMVGPFLLRPVGAVGMVGESSVLAGSVVGLVFVIAGKLSLGRSLGLLPANRGVVCRALPAGAAPDIPGLSANPHRLSSGSCLDLERRRTGHRRSGAPFTRRVGGAYAVTRSRLPPL